MSTLSSQIPICDDLGTRPFEYRDIREFSLLPELARPRPEENSEGSASGESGAAQKDSQKEIDRKVESAKEEGLRLGIERSRAELNAAVAHERSRILAAIDKFHRETALYYSRVEDEIVHLSLAIAAKILHREAQVDRLLLAGLARVAMQMLQQGTKVSIRIPPADVEEWRRSFGASAPTNPPVIVADATLGANDCIVETESGTVQLGLEAQLKEIEQGFFDLLAHRPECS